ncbi:plasminogen-binding group A streptococcal M-like protein PAM [Montipora capricornis]|uniref:plasminogen-binding group A streptococcal M-like protein PAM n=1 Tax=Montipora capricornis TaxID=246305 RepID=UPI0035F1A764
MQSSGGEQMVYVREVKSVIGKSLAAREVMSQVWDEKSNGSNEESDNDDLEEKQNGGVWDEDSDDVDDDDHSKTLRGKDVEKRIEKEKGPRLAQTCVEHQHDLEAEKKKSLTAEIEQTKQERNALQQEKEQLQEQTNQIGQIIRDRDAEVKNLKGEVNGLRTSLSKAINAGEVLQKELDESRDENKLMQEALITYERDFKRECDEKRDTMHQLQEMEARLKHEMDKHTELNGRYRDACRARVCPNETSLPDTPQPPRRSV